MTRAATICLCIVVFLSLAYGRIALDGFHSLPDGEDYGIHLDSLFQTTHFVSFGASRLPMYDILAEGMVQGEWWDTVGVDLPTHAPALYVWLDVDLAAPEFQLPVPRIIAPDQSVTSGGYGICHLDDAAAGHYVVEVVFGMSNIGYRIGTGPHLWDVYPPEDYGAIIDLHAFTWMLFRGVPTPHSVYDLQRLQQMLNAGGGLGIFYDGAEPIALKPVIHTQGFAKQGASIEINIPGRLTYALPAPKARQPLHWQIAPTEEDNELYYEAEFDRPLNFVARDLRSGSLTNESWATVRNLRLIRFMQGTGYQISDYGTLKPGEKAFAIGGITLSYFPTRQVLGELMQSEGLAAGMTASEAESFFPKYGWAARILADASQADCPIALYRIEGEDYDALFPMQTDPTPEEVRRILWVWSIMPESVSAIQTAHPRVSEARAVRSTRRAGRFHEYGFFRETYGGNALDDLTEWGWNFCDEVLEDPTDNAGSANAIFFHTWGGSPLVPTLSMGVTQVQGSNTCAIMPESEADIVLSGDDDTQAADPNSPFQPGTFPPVVVARAEPAGGRLAGTADLQFFNDEMNNLQFMTNVLNWLESGQTGHGPDIDMPIAVAETTLIANSSTATQFKVFNLGDEPLSYSTTLPAETWISATGPVNNVLAAGDSATYTVIWSSEQLSPGYYTTQWTFLSNDANESVLNWPVRLRVLGSEAVDPRVTSTLPENFEILESYPNPFNSEVTLSFTVPRQGVVSFELYDVLGRRAATFPQQEWAAGKHRIHVDLAARSAGLYFLRAEYAGSVSVRKLMLLK
jgi:hypothetical protein